MDGVELLQNCVRFGYSLLYFLRPLDNEKSLIYNVNSFLSSAGIDSTKTFFKLCSVMKGFDFLGWHFKLSNKNYDIISCPSKENFQVFLQRVKHIINNSNYGCAVKINKLYPIIKEWRIYHKYSILKKSRFSLFFVKKKAFKIFSKESKQDFYSIKRLLDKAFYDLKTQDKLKVDKIVLTSPYYGHLAFWKYYFKDSFILKKNYICCVHCGVNLPSN